MILLHETEKTLKRKNEKVSLKRCCLLGVRDRLWTDHDSAHIIDNYAASCSLFNVKQRDISWKFIRRLPLNLTILAVFIINKFLNGRRAYLGLSHTMCSSFFLNFKTCSCPRKVSRLVAKTENKPTWMTVKTQNLVECFNHAWSRPSNGDVLLSLGTELVMDFVGD